MDNENTQTELNNPSASQLAPLTYNPRVRHYSISNALNNKIKEYPKDEQKLACYIDNALIEMEELPEYQAEPEYPFLPIPYAALNAQHSRPQKVIKRMDDDGLLKMYNPNDRPNGFYQGGVGKIGTPGYIKGECRRYRRTQESMDSGIVLIEFIVKKHPKSKKVARKIKADTKTVGAEITNKPTKQPNFVKESIEYQQKFFDEFTFVENPTLPTNIRNIHRAENTYNDILVGNGNFKKGGKVNRITNTFVNSLKEIRPNFRLKDGSKIADGDIACCHFYLAATLCKNPDAVKRIFDFINSGDSYKHWGDYLFNKTGEIKERKEVQSDFLTFLNGYGKSRLNYIHDCLIDEGHIDFVAGILTMEGCAAATKYQNLEAEWICHRLVLKCKAAGIPILTAHDGWVTRPEFNNKVAALAAEIGEEMVSGRPKIKLAAELGGATYIFGANEDVIILNTETNTSDDNQVTNNQTTNNLMPENRQVTNNSKEESETPKRGLYVTNNSVAHDKCLTISNLDNISPPILDDNHPILPIIGNSPTHISVFSNCGEMEYEEKAKIEAAAKAAERERIIKEDRDRMMADYYAGKGISVPARQAAEPKPASDTPKVSWIELTQAQRAAYGKAQGIRKAAAKAYKDQTIPGKTPEEQAKDTEIACI